MKNTMKKIGDILSWVLLIAMLILMVFSIYNTIEARKSGESAFLFGYRPVLVLTGSMEPYMMTNGLALTKEVTSMDEIAVGDVITYHIESESGRMLRITHRIIHIEDEKIFTKGDNNYVEDGFYLTMDNVEAKVIAVFNQTAWIAEKWQTTAGKVMLISIPLCIILLFYTLKLFFASAEEEKDAPAEGKHLADSKDESKDEQKENAEDEI